MGQNEQKRQLTEGDTAPQFTFHGPDGKVLRSSELLREAPVLLTFYRGAWCTCCQSDLRDLMRTMPAIRKSHSTVLGVFHQLGPNVNARISREYALDFPLVDDAEGRAAEAFGIRRSASEIARIEEDFGPEMLALKQGEPWIMPMQARFLIGKDGIIARSEIISNYGERTNAEGLIPILERIS
jgi:peroxiredoxin